MLPASYSVLPTPCFLLRALPTPCLLLRASYPDLHLFYYYFKSFDLRLKRENCIFDIRKGCKVFLLLRSPTRLPTRQGYRGLRDSIARPHKI